MCVKAVCVPSPLLTPECSTFSPPATVILLILLCFEGLLFLIFTSVMFGTQIHSICTDETVRDCFLQQWANVVEVVLVVRYAVLFLG